MAEEIPPGAGAAFRPSARELFDRYHGRIVRFFKARRFSEDDALDLTQETLSRVLRHMDELRSEGSLEAWVLRVAANVWKNELRSRQAAKRGERELSLDAVLADGPEPDEPAMPGWGPAAPDPLAAALAAEEVRVVEGCFDQLPPQRKRCLLLHVAQELKYHEIATLLRLSIESVKSHIYQARRQVKECVARKLAGAAT